MTSMATIAPVPANYAQAVHHSFPVWRNTFVHVTLAKTDACTAVRAQDGRWDLILVLFRGDGERIQVALPINPGGPPVVVNEEMTKWGFVQLGPSVWALVPSLDTGNYHGFVVVRNVPEPAPWLLDVPASANGTMDPDVNLNEQREIQARLELARMDDFARDNKQAAQDLNRVSILARDMDGWLRRGGALPAAWKQAYPVHVHPSAKK
jgi:hypothetical protein